MKTKKFNKRLALNKTTIANFINKEMKNVKGGACLTQWNSCTTYGEYSCLVDPYVCYSYPRGVVCKDPES